MYPAARSRSCSDGRADCVDILASSDGRGNSSKIFLYLGCPNLESADFCDRTGDMALECSSLGRPCDGDKERARDGGGLRSGEDFVSGEVVGSVAGTTVASDC